jgi:hypothetical protein
VFIASWIGLTSLWFFVLPFIISSIVCLVCFSNEKVRSYFGVHRP